MRSPLCLLVAVATLLALAASAHAAAPSCGYAKFPDDPESGAGGEYYSWVSHRRDIGCRAARRVLKRAERRGKPLFVCSGRARFDGWTVRHAGRSHEMSSWWTKGGRRFRFTETQGSC